MISISNTKCRFLVVDLTSKDSQGHFIQASIDIVNALHENGEQVSFVAEYASQTSKFLVSNEIALFSEFVGPSNLKNCLEGKISDAERTHVLIMWSGDLLEFDFTEIEVMCLQRSADLSMITNASKILRGWPNPEKEMAFISKLLSLKSLKNIWVWDPAAKNQKISSKIRWLPEYHSSFINREAREQSGKVVGFYGSLSINRGLGEVLLIAALNPDLKFRIKGYGEPNFWSWRPLNYQSKFKNPLKFVFSLIVASTFVSLIKLRNVKVTNVYFENDEVLVGDMKTCSVLFYAADRHPYSSGISLLGLASGIPVIWLRGNSAANDNLYKKFPEGMFDRKFILSRRRFRKKLNDALTSEISSLNDWETLKIALKESHID
jgi:hypothetical protein